MAAKLDYLSPEAQAALDLAKQAVPEGESLTPELLMAAAYHVGDMQHELPQLGPYLPEPARVHEKVPKRVPVADSLRPILYELSHDEMVTLDELMTALVDSEAGQSLLAARGLPASELEDVTAALTGQAVPTTEERPAEEPVWRESSERREVIEALSSYGRMLTAGEPPQKGIVEMDRQLRALQKNLIKMRRPNLIIVGQPGTGKSDWKSVV